MVSKFVGTSAVTKKQKKSKLATTGYDLPENREKIFSAGADDYLPKPFAVEELRKRVDKLPEE